MSYTNKNGIVINEPEKPLPEEGSVTGGVLAGLNNALLPIMPALKYSVSPSFFALKTLAQNYDPNLFNTENPTYRETKGFQSTVGDLFNPANLILGGVAGKALGAIGAFTSEAAQTALGITGSQVIGKTAATIAPKVLTGAAEGMGWTLLDHYERQAGLLNDELSNTNIALGAGFGGVLGLGAGIASRYLNKTDEQVGAQIANNVDIKLNTVTANADKQYNTQNKMGYDLSHELPPLDNRTTEKPMLPSTEEANYLPPIDEKTTGNVPTLNIKVPEISDETLAKLNLTRDSEIVKRDEKAILQAQRLDKHHKDLDSIDDSIVANIQHYHTKYDNIIINSPHGKHLYSGDDLSLRKGVTGEHSGLSEADIGTGDMVNGLNLTMFDDAQGLNIDRGFIQGYIEQNYNALQLAVITPNDYIQLMQETLKKYVDSDTLRGSFEMLSNRDLDPRIMSVSSNPYKARVYDYKDAEAQLKVENAIGNPNTLANKVNAQIDKAADLHGRVAVLGTEDPQKTLHYFAKLKKVNPKTAENKIGSMLGLGKTYLDNDVLRLGGEIIKTATNTSKAVNVLFKPLSGILNAVGDFTMVHMNVWANYGISKVLRAEMGNMPTEDIMAFASLPKETQTLNGIIKDFKHEMVNDTYEMMGIKFDNKLARYNKLASASQVKFGGLHILDKWLRKFNLKLIANIIKWQYAKDGLAKMFPSINKDILKEAVNKEGFLAPTKLTAKADLLSKAGNLKLAQEYRDVATKLYTEYAKINRANPIYSNSNRWLQKLDPVVAHGARNVLWRLRMIAGLYKSFLEGSNGTNKVLAFSGIAAASSAIALMEASEKHALSLITGNEEYDQKVPLINKGLKETIPNSFIRNWAISSVNTMLPLSMFYNTPIVYGSGTKAIRAAYHEIASENWGGNPEKAKQDLLQAMPYLGVMTNVWANHTDVNLEQQNKNRAK